jgi:hypothetical protein
MFHGPCSGSQASLWGCQNRFAQSFVARRPTESIGALGRDRQSPRASENMASPQLRTEADSVTPIVQLTETWVRVSRRQPRLTVHIAPIDQMRSHASMPATLGGRRRSGPSSDGSCKYRDNHVITN